MRLYTSLRTFGHNRVDLTDRLLQTDLNETDLTLDQK